MTPYAAIGVVAAALFAIGLLVGFAVVYRRNGVANFVTRFVYGTPVLADVAAVAERQFAAHLASQP